MSNINLTNYEMNKQAYASENFKFDPKKISADLDLAANNFFCKDCRYVGLLCRERNDYTVFKLSKNVGNFENELKEILYDRGAVVDILYDYNDISENYQIWVRERRSDAVNDLEKDFKFEWTPQVWMYMLFDATDWVIEVGD